MATHDQPVLIVGAGPTGLTAALSLLQNGIPVRIVTKNHEPMRGQKGSSVMPRTLEIHKFLGTIDDVEKRARYCHPLQMFQPGSESSEPFFEFEMLPRLDATPDRPYPSVMLLGQSNHESLLRTHLSKHTCSVEFGVELRSFQDNESHVSATLVQTHSSGEEKTEEVKTPFLISAEGAHSLVRKQCGITFLGETRRTESLLVGDIEVLAGLDNEKWRIWGNVDTRMVALRPVEDASSKYQSILCGGKKFDYSKAMSSRDAWIETFYEVTGRKNVRFGDLLWLSHYTPNIRMANTFSKGRCFIAGDACHVHSPSGGQGLNSGIQDAFNLSWKLALVLKGLAAPSLLSSYSKERVPVINTMLQKTTKMQDMIARARNRDRDASESHSGSNRNDWVKNRDPAFDMLGITYAGSGIVLDETGSPHHDDYCGSGSDQGKTEAYSSGTVLRAGDRAPDAPGLLDLAGEKETSLYDIFKPFRHTALVFAADFRKFKNVVSVVSALRRYPSGTIHIVLILPREWNETFDSDSNVDQVLIDGRGHVWSSYMKDTAVIDVKVAIVRPDGYVGALVFEGEGVERYRKIIFSN